MSRVRSFALAAFLLAAAGSLAAWQYTSTFESAGGGAPIAFQPIALPALATGFHGFKPDTFAPTVGQVLSGETIVKTPAQMKQLWKNLFAIPYDPTLFDFSHDFVVLMGSGPLVAGSFDISAVEEVTATYANPGGPGGPTTSDEFLAITSTTFLPGVQQSEPPPPSYRIVAVRIPLDHLHDVVFHRAFIMGV